tara:strand:+ start:2541 stop:2831 length:291 start_codon:yes stop_codon:yes gene_type:complete
MEVMVMALNKEEKESLENSIYDCHFASQKYLETGKDIHFKLLEVSVNEAISNLQILKEGIKDDPMVGNYKIHLLVPLQLLRLAESRNKKDQEVKNI